MIKKLLLTAAVAGFFAAPHLAAQRTSTFTGAIMDSQCAAKGSHEAMTKEQTVSAFKSCTEACVGMGGKYVLYDAASKTVYQLDDQSKPKPFAGERVRVTGTLDNSTKTIHVADIQRVS